MKEVDYKYYKELVLREIPLEPCGKHHKDIAFNIGLGKVKTRNVIKMLRDDGYPICSNATDGYWMARTSNEIQDVINMFNSYIHSMQMTVESLTRTKLDKMREEGNIL